MNFFFDNNLPPRLARALSFLSKPDGHTVVPLLDKFERNTPDVDWITTLSQEKNDWVIISGDKNIIRKKHERAAWKESELTAFFLKKGWNNIDFWNMSWKLVKWWPIIVNQATQIQPGTGFLVPLSGNKLTPFFSK